MSLSYEEIFADQPLAWGNKYPRESRLLDIWRRDPGYLRWACNLETGKPKHNFELPPLQRAMVRVAHALSVGHKEEAKKLFESFSHWRALSQEGVGLADLKRPSAKHCKDAISDCTKLVGHFDLDGIFSLALLVANGALSTLPESERCDAIKLVQYGLNSLDAYSQAIDLRDNDRVVIADFAAHPGASLTFDHHSTCLSHWEIGTPLPTGVYDTSCPSCPGLIAAHCGFEISTEARLGCDMIDGARYPDVQSTLDLSNPYVAMNLALGTDLSDRSARECVLELADEKLNPATILARESWQARLALIRCQIAEQRNFWRQPGILTAPHGLLAIADARNAPNSTTRYRYLPFELETAAERPYLVTLRPSRRGESVQLGISRNPFFSEEFFTRHPLDLGALCRRVGLQGGGRIEAAAATTSRADLAGALDRLTQAIENSAV